MVTSILELPARGSDVPFDTAAVTTAANRFLSLVRLVARLLYVLDYHTVVEPHDLARAYRAAMRARRVSSGLALHEFRREIRTQRAAVQRDAASALACVGQLVIDDLQRWEAISFLRHTLGTKVCASELFNLHLAEFDRLLRPRRPA